MGKKWKTSRTRRAVGYLLAALILFAGTSSPARQLWNTPGSLELTRGQTLQLNYQVPLLRSEADDAQVLSSLDERLGGGMNVALTGQTAGSTQLVLSLLGVPVKTVNVTVREERVVMPGGSSIGVALNMAGVLVVGASDVGGGKSPARAAGLRAGDLIVAVNGEAVTSAQRLSELIGKGGHADLKVDRAGRQMDVELEPVKDSRDGVYRLGAWVRDSTAGVGTLTYVDIDSGTFGALGHAITDADTGTLLTVSEGAIYESRVLDVLPGTAGEPGELLGEFFSDARKIGDVKENGVFGLYGSMNEPAYNLLYPQGVPVRTRNEVTEGPAQILTTLDGGGVKAYDCEITRLYQQDAPAQRGMSLKITDSELLKRTGGIVQGMSGSPILQNGCLVGAVTHVFLNDPTQGYGMYIEWMLDRSDKNNA